MSDSSYNPNSRTFLDQSNVRMTRPNRNLRAENPVHQQQQEEDDITVRPVNDNLTLNAQQHPNINMRKTMANPNPVADPMADQVSPPIVVNTPAPLVTQPLKAFKFCPHCGESLQQ